MVSSGIRLGAWDFLKFKHVVPLRRDGKIVAAKLIVYADEDDEYFTFISSEAYYELEKWKEYRIQSGEPVSIDSWVMRNIWNTKKGNPQEWERQCTLSTGEASACAKYAQYAAKFGEKAEDIYRFNALNFYKGFVVPDAETYYKEQLLAEKLGIK